MALVPYLLIFSAPALLIAGHLLGGAGNFLVLCALFVMAPLTDLVMGLDTRNPPDVGRKGRLGFRLLTWLVVPVQVAVVGWGTWVASRGELTPLELAGLVLSTGATSGTMGITIAHELVHSRESLERRLGELLLATVCYTHWGIAHVWGHHRFVATPRDPATARLGESVYRFLPRCIVGGYLDAWTIEGRRLQRLGHTRWHISNRMIWYTVAPSVVSGTLLALLGSTAALFFLGQSAVAVLLLEVINYVEHYGLIRSRRGEAGWEPVTPAHSWNASFRFSNWGLFNLQKHSDHHANAYRPYEALRHHPDSPQLPIGYGAMVFLAMVPPLWRRVMDPRVRQHPSAQSLAPKERHGQAPLATPG